MKKALFFTFLVCLSSLYVMGQNTKNKKADCELSQPTGVEEQHAYVDLGLSAMWATCNVGAMLPEDYGEYYVWGETETKEDNSWRSYKWGNGEYRLTKYCTYSEYGNMDDKDSLDPEDDAAHVKWGGNWRMPTIAEMIELMEKCKWTWTKHNGVRGYKVTSKINGNSIFLPAAGSRGDIDIRNAGKEGCYWTSTVYNLKPYDAFLLALSPNDAYAVRVGRCGGNTIRPVISIWAQNQK